jgi:hypothetical protein
MAPNPFRVRASIAAGSGIGQRLVPDENTRAVGVSPQKVDDQTCIVDELGLEPSDLLRDFLPQLSAR